MPTVRLQILVEHLREVARVTADGSEAAHISTLTPPGFGYDVQQWDVELRRPKAGTVTIFYAK